MSTPQPQQQHLQADPYVSPPTPPSGQTTPTSAPGTPNSTTTSLSALSTTAIKDGHRGSAHPHAFPFSHSTSTPGGTPFNAPSSTNTLAAERADRISRLPGFGTTASGPRVKSTVGSASATGSVGRTTVTGDGSEMGSEMELEGSDAGTDTAVAGDGVEVGERITRRLEPGGAVGGGKMMKTPDEREGLGKFYFEEGAKR